MNAADVIGYAYDASLHCEKCTRARFPNADEEFSDVEDSEGNPIHPIFAGDELDSSEYCDDCGDEIYELEEEEPKYASAHDWLDSYLTTLAEVNDITALFAEAKTLASLLDADQIQDEYQTEMSKDGYFGRKK